MTSRRTTRADLSVQQSFGLPGEAETGFETIENMKLEKGLFITFEGGEGAGKTTQASRLAKRIADLGIDVHLTREPGGTELGESIRSLVKRESNIGIAAETLMFGAARAQLVSEVIRPKLRRKSVVIVDRYVDSTIAYQGYGRGVSLDRINAINEIATGGLLPELTVLLDADPREVLSRVEVTPSLFEGNSGDGVVRDGDRADERRFENEPVTFHEKVTEGYRTLAQEGGRWCVIRADQAQHRVADAIWKRVRTLLTERGVDEELLKRKQGSRTE